MKRKNIIIIVSCVLALIVGVITIILINKNTKNDIDSENQIVQESKEEKEEIVEEKKENIIEEKVDIIDVTSKSRPYAIVVNNTPVAVKVQEGLNKAYLVYEIPTEGNTSRLMALYKDIEEDLVVGTIRSARHNFIDYALESDAIFCCFGWSHYAQDEMKKGVIDYSQGLFGGPYYRTNPEGLALEHTAYTSISGLNNEIKNKGIRTTSDNSILLNYSGSDVELVKANNSRAANKVVIPYGAAPQITTFEYDSASKMYLRYENGIKCIDHNTKETVSTKNIIVQKIGYSMCSDNYYWDLKTVGKGDGYYVTCGHAVAINWEKNNRNAKTVYTYAQGTVIDGKDVSGQEILVSDGRTWIEIQTTNQTLSIQ